MKEITVQELNDKIENGDEVFIVDVREVFEKYQSDIEYDRKTLIPMGELQNRVGELEEYKDQEVICICRSGSRSARACSFLEKRGFSNVKNLKGGINQWAREIDPDLPVY